MQGIPTVREKAAISGKCEKKGAHMQGIRRVRRLCIVA